MAGKLNKNRTYSPVSISANWQLLFIITMGLYWVVGIAALMIFYVGAGNYINSGTWIYQTVQWLYPLAFFAIALWFVWRRYSQILHRLFQAMFIATIGVTLLTLLTQIETTLRLRFYPPDPASYTANGLWGAFGDQWIVMIAGIVVYVAVLARAAKRLGKTT